MHPTQLGCLCCHIILSFPVLRSYVCNDCNHIKALTSNILKFQGNKSYTITYEPSAIQQMSPYIDNNIASIQIYETTIAQTETFPLLIHPQAAKIIKAKHNIGDEDSVYGGNNYLMEVHVFYM